MARSRGRTNEFGSSTPKFLFSNTGEGAGAEKKKLVGAESEGDLFGPAEGGSWKGDPGRDITKRRTLHSSHHHRDRKSRDGKAELPNNPETETRKLKKNLVPISHHLNHLDHSLPPHPPSSARKRAYHEILDENPEPHHNIHSFTPVKLSRSNSYSSKALIPPVLPASLKKSKSFAFGAGGGEDYYIPDHESDKENNDGPSLLSSSQPTIKSHYLSEQASTTTTTTTTKKMKPRPPRNSDIAKSTVAKMKNINAAPRRVASAPALKGSIGTGASNSNGTSAAMGIPKKRKVLGESRLSGSASSASSTSATISPPLLPSSKAYVPARTVGEEERERKKEERPRVEEGDLGDLGGAELLLSLSAGVWR